MYALKICVLRSITSLYPVSYTHLIWAEEETLLTDEDGVYRDPNLHFDGQHLLFSWKKSAKDDDFHLYEMDLKTREVKQLTFGKGHADIEGIYLPDENILFNSTRSGSAVDCWFTEVSNMYPVSYTHLSRTVSSIP